jgi:hypothetical protein
MKYARIERERRYLVMESSLELRLDKSFTRMGDEE